MDPSEFPAADARPGHRNAVRYGTATAAEIVRRVGEGESVHAISKEPGMPTPNTVWAWTKERPGFAAALAEARARVGGPYRGRRALWCEETAQAIYERVCAGEALTAICAEPGMPSMSTLTNWRKQQPKFAEALEEAYEIRAETWFDRGLAIAEAITPQTAYASEVKLKHLRWYVGKLGPRKYGGLKAVEPPAPVAPQMTVTMKSFWLERGPGGQQRVRARWYDSARNAVVTDVPGDWGPWPQDAKYLTPSEQRDVAAAEAAAAAGAAASDDDDDDRWT